MPYLLQLAVDKPFRLQRNTHYFSYQGVSFKYVQHPQRAGSQWSDLLLTIVDSSDSPMAQKAFSVAGTWAAALSWEVRRPISIRMAGGASWHSSFPLRRARGNIFTWPRLPFLGKTSGFDFSRIANVTDENQRKALVIYREAQVSNSVLLSILLNWQVLEVWNSQPVGWINNQVKKGTGYMTLRNHLSALHLGTRKLGEYLLNDCRHAIAHLRRDPGRKAIEFDSITEVRRLGSSAVVLEALARRYIETHLKLTDHMWLARPRGRGAIRYVPSAEYSSGSYRLVHERFQWRLTTA
jgi:hypothetical protein